MLCAESFRRDRCGRCAAGSTRGVKPKTHRANPAVTQGQTGQPRADSTAPNPERRCGCGTRHDLRDNVGANDRFFSRSRLPEAKAAREPLPRLRPFTSVRPQAEPTRGPAPPPGHSQPVPRPPRCVPQRHRTGRAICTSPGVTGPHSPADDALCWREEGFLAEARSEQRSRKRVRPAPGLSCAKTGRRKGIARAAGLQCRSHEMPAL
jgi:hypothetical protein